MTKALSLRSRVGSFRSDAKSCCCRRRRRKQEATDEARIEMVAGGKISPRHREHGERRTRACEHAPYRTAWRASNGTRGAKKGSRTIAARLTFVLQWSRDQADSCWWRLLEPLLPPPSWRERGGGIRLAGRPIRWQSDRTESFAP